MSEALFTATIDGVCVTVYPGLVECTAMVDGRLQRLKLFEVGDLNEAAAEFWDHVGGKPKEEDSNYQYECPECGSHTLIIEERAYQQYEFTPDGEIGVVGGPVLAGYYKESWTTCPICHHAGELKLFDTDRV